MQEPRATGGGAVDPDELLDLTQQIHDANPHLTQEEARTSAISEVGRPHHD